MDSYDTVILGRVKLCGRMLGTLVYGRQEGRLVTVDEIEEGLLVAQQWEGRCAAWGGGVWRAGLKQMK